MHKVLMIEDEEDLVRFFEEAFRHFKEIRFLSALRAREGIETAKRERPDCVIVDLRMPGLSGEEALRQIKAEFPETKSVVLTAWDDGDTRERVEREIGVDAYFEKPVDLERVIGKVMELLMVK
ncbi:MAG: response regulator [Candidatus Omnitrophica bacterium]|nr:response regulator [Candidatus Omnitrophota bacterium]